MRRTELRRKAPLLHRIAAKVRRPQNTGPDEATRLAVWMRAGGACEWPGCPAMATDVHHRLNRKMGGRRGDMRLLLNSPAWLLSACRAHHAAVTSAHGVALAEARQKGWVLFEGDDARWVPVRTRHGLVYLTDEGGVDRDVSK